jgi:transmembrane E3 ubiquitin-protein ligase
MSTPPLPPILGRGDEAGIPATTDRPQRGSVTSLLILSLFIFLMTNNGGNDDPTVRNHYKDNLSSLEWQLGNYSAWLNGSDTTNFTMVRSRICIASPSPLLNQVSSMNSLLGHRASIVSYPRLYRTEAF